MQVASWNGCGFGEHTVTLTSAFHSKVSRDVMPSGQVGDATMATAAIQNVPTASIIIIQTFFWVI